MSDSSTDAPLHQPSTPPLAAFTAGVSHYENFPVASFLCPRRLRPAVLAIYRFARTADDIADEGQASASERLTRLAACRQMLNEGSNSSLDRAIREYALPTALLHDLLSAFEQDVRRSASGQRYASMAELLDYCRLSANPVGRLLLHLYGVQDALSLQQSDQICSALQLINFWQDLSLDLPRGRCYLPSDALQGHGLRMEDFLADNSVSRPCDALAQQTLVAELCAHARDLLLQGAPLARRVPGRAGWELRLVVQGGLRIIERLAALEHRSWQSRPTLGRRDLPRLLWRALRG
ncbi:squalene synthase HpnC [Hydrogenophaga sp.]|uniref:squalene synthase HpnC n=1 Tax=Hydrogenophaga sp. TaxID=1904254 RepID=UPI0019ACC7B6|nr:squalene synthase HpnC [Hydrogenophaga sp.]MBD3893616.1 squalene synthase HpnC [Hydrogenophaga sp.]